MVAPDRPLTMHRQEKEMTNEKSRLSPRRVSTNDQAILLLRDRQRAATRLNNLLQAAMGDSRVADTYQAFRVRYLRALGKFRPAEYVECDVVIEEGDPDVIREYMRMLRKDEKEKKECCSQLQSAWLLYDTLAIDKPEILGADEQRIEEEMDEFEEELFEEWQDFAEEVIARAEFEEDDDSDIVHWRLELKEIRKDLKLIKWRNAERDEMRKKAVRRVQNILRAVRGGEDVSETVHDDDDDDDSSNDKESGVTSKSSKTAKSSKSNKSKKKKSKKDGSERIDEDGSENDLNLRSSMHSRTSAHSRKKKKDKEKKSSKKSSKKKDKSKRRSSDNDSQDKLLEEVFPPHIAKALREGRKVEPESKECVTIFFSDIVGFTSISATLSPLKVSDMLDRLYQKFDALSHHHDVFKVETIGDSWMGATNLTKDQPDHAQRVARFAVEALKASQETWVDEEDHSLGKLNLRVGFHSGPVVANVVGSRNPRYCLFGDTVNTASRMESHSLPGRIHCSDASAAILKKDAGGLLLSTRGKIQVKGKGLMETYFVRDETIPEAPAPVMVFPPSPQRVSRIFGKAPSGMNASRPVRQRSLATEVDLKLVVGQQPLAGRVKRRPKN